MNQFIVHSSLDIIEEVQWASSTMYMKCVDRFNNLFVSCFLTAGSTFLSVYIDIYLRTLMFAVFATLTDIKFLLLHDTKADDAIRQFFADVYELYAKTLMNPFYEVDMRITSLVFDTRVRGAAKKYL